jgi:uncharacterized protein YkwD
MWALVVLLGLSSAPADIHEVSRGMKLRMVELINRDRAQAGAPPVEFSLELSRAADKHSREMLEHLYSSHWNRAGWKPYLRYAAAGSRDATAENIWSLNHTNFPLNDMAVWEWLYKGHQSFMDEKPPDDGHRQTVLNPWHTQVGIGVAYSSAGMRLVQVFASRYAELEPVPLRVTLADSVVLQGRPRRPRWEVAGIAVYYEPLPRPLSFNELQSQTSYSLPDEERTERPRVSGGIYTDRASRTVEVDSFGRFRLPLSFWKGQPGVYTAVVWVRTPGGQTVMGAMTSLIVEQRKTR